MDEKYVKISGMNDKFFDIRKEKQDRMINAILKVFAQHGYRHACTDDIVREAAISKGLLFHYFESKLGAYRFAYDYSVRYLSLELKPVTTGGSADLFSVMRQIEEARMRATSGYPYLQMFLYRAACEDVSEALLATEEKRNLLESVYESIYDRVDFLLLPSGVDGEKLRKMLEFTIQGLTTERFLQGALQPEMLCEEICDYLGMVERLVRR